MATSGKPFQAFPGQDHKAHIDAHLSFYVYFYGTKQSCSYDEHYKKIYLNIFHYMAQEQIQLEFVEEMQELQMIQQQLATNDAKPTNACNK